MRASERKIILVTREVRLDALLRRFNTVTQAKYFVKSRGGNFEDSQDEASSYRSAEQDAVTFLQSQGIVQTLNRAFLPNFVFGPDDLILCLGQDGLVANTLKYTNGQPVVGINPDPDRYDGVLLPFQLKDLNDVLPALLKNKIKYREVTFAEATLNDGRSFLAVNDFFIGPKTHTSARYQIQLGQHQESHSSSGLIVSTGLGSTGWFKSLLTGALAIAASWQSGSPQPAPQDPPRIPWDADHLFFTVREPFPSRVSSAGLVFGKVTKQTPLILHSQMSDNGVIFSDGIESDFLEFNSGAVATIRPSDRRGRLVVA